MTSYAMKYASSIVTAHLASNKMDPKEIPDFIEEVFGRIVKLDASSAEPIATLKAETSQVAVVAADAAISNFVAPARDPGESLAAAPSPVNFDAHGWLASLPERNAFTDAEALRNNHHLNKGWVGVHDTNIVCLLDGKPVRVLTSHLKRYYQDDPRGSSLAAYRAHFRLPPDYPSSAPDFHALKSGSIKASYKVRRGEVTRRSDDLQAKITGAILKAGLDPADQLKPETRPGVFAHTIVCLECGAKTGDIVEHLADKHPKLSFVNYIKAFKASSRYPQNPPQPEAPRDPAKAANAFMEANDRPASKQVNAAEWPGVFEKFIICLHDGEEITNLEDHLHTVYGQSMDEYRADWWLPASYPSMAPAIAATQVASAPAAAPAGKKPAGKAPVGRPRREGTIGLFTR